MRFRYIPPRHAKRRVYRMLRQIDLPAHRALRYQKAYDMLHALARRWMITNEGEQDDNSGQELHRLWIHADETFPHCEGYVECVSPTGHALGTGHRETAHFHLVGETFAEIDWPPILVEAELAASAIGASLFYRTPSPFADGGICHPYIIRSATCPEAPSNSAVV